MQNWAKRKWLRRGFVESKGMAGEGEWCSLAWNVLRFDYKDTLGERWNAESKEEKLVQREDFTLRYERVP